MTVTRQDLTDIGDADYANHRNEYVQCQDCEARFGGTRGDYFMTPMDRSFRCPNCNSENLALVRDVVTTVRVK